RTGAPADAAVLHGLRGAGRRRDTTIVEIGGAPADLRPAVALCAVEHDLGRYRVASLRPECTRGVLRRRDHRIADDRFALLVHRGAPHLLRHHTPGQLTAQAAGHALSDRDRKSTRLNSSHVSTSYAVFC